MRRGKMWKQAIISLLSFAGDFLVIQYIFYSLQLINHTITRWVLQIADAPIGPWGYEPCRFGPRWDHKVWVECLRFLCPSSPGHQLHNLGGSQHAICQPFLPLKCVTLDRQASVGWTAGTLLLPGRPLIADGRRGPQRSPTSQHAKGSRVSRRTPCPPPLTLGICQGHR